MQPAAPPARCLAAESRPCRRTPAQRWYACRPALTDRTGERGRGVWRAAGCKHGYTAARGTGSRQHRGSTHSRYQGGRCSRQSRKERQLTGCGRSGDKELQGRKGTGKKGQAWVWSSAHASAYSQLTSNSQMAAALCMPTMPDQQHLHQWQPVPVHAAHPTWLPLVLGPALAMDRVPAPVALSSRVISS